MKVEPKSRLILFVWDAGRARFRLEGIKIGLGARMFENSPNSKVIWEFFNAKYGQMIAPVGLLKVLSAISPFVNGSLPNLNVFLVTPSRQFKSRTSIEVMKMVNANVWVDLGDDVTMNSILSRFRGKIKKKALFINDGTVLFSSKSKQVKDRLISGLTTLLSEGKWFYGDRQSPENTLEGHVSIIMNMTLESYNKYESGLLGSTFLERFITVFYSMPIVELIDFIEKKEEKTAKKWQKRLKFMKKPIKNMSEYKKVLMDYAQRYSALAMKSLNGCNDQICALIQSHLSLNGRDEIVSDDIDLLKVLEPYLVNPFAPNQHRIIELYRQHRSYKDICLILGKTEKGYKSYVSKVIKKARERGVV